MCGDMRNDLCADQSPRDDASERIIAGASPSVLAAHRALLDAREAHQNAERAQIFTKKADAATPAAGAEGPDTLAAVRAAENALADSPSVTLADIALKIGAAADTNTPAERLRKIVAAEIEAMIARTAC